MILQMYIMLRNFDIDCRNTEVRSKSPEATIDVEPQLRANITKTVLDCITFALFKNKLAMRVIGEINVRLEKVVSRVHKQQHAMRFGTERVKV